MYRGYRQRKLAGHRSKFEIFSQILDYAQGEHVSIYQIMRHLGLEHGRLKGFLSELESSGLLESKVQDKDDRISSLSRWAAKIHESGNWQRRKLYLTTPKGIGWLSQFQMLNLQISSNRDLNPVEQDGGRDPQEKE